MRTVLAYFDRHPGLFAGVLMAHLVMFGGLLLLLVSAR